jgi:sulfur-carrier protein
VPVEILYFAWVRERMGQGGERVILPAALATIADLIAWLAVRDAAGAAAFADPQRIRAAIDGAMCPASAPIAGAREIALFPPVTGG